MQQTSIYEQIMASKARQIVTENLSEVNDATLNDLLLEVEFEVKSIEALEDQILSLAETTNEDLSEEVISLHVELANVIGTAKHTLEALDCIQNEADSSNSVATTLAKKTLLQRLKDTWTKFINWLRTAGLKRALKNEWVVFDQKGLDNMVESLQTHKPIEGAPGAFINSRAKDVKELTNISKRFNSYMSIFTERTEELLIDVSNKRSSKNIGKPVDVPTLEDIIDDEFLDNLGIIRNEDTDITKPEPADTYSTFDKLEVPAPGSKATLEGVKQVLNDTQRIGLSTAVVAKLMDELAGFAQDCKKELADSDDEAYPAINSDQLKVIAVYLKFLKVFQKFRQQHCKLLLKDLRAWHYVVMNNTE